MLVVLPHFVDDCTLSMLFHIPAEPFAHTTSHHGYIMKGNIAMKLSPRLYIGFITYILRLSGHDDLWNVSFIQLII